MAMMTLEREGGVSVERRTRGMADADARRRLQRRSIRCLRLPGALRAADLPRRADGGLRHRRAALPLSAQPLQRAAAGLDLRAARDRHDLRHPDRRHRPFDRLAGRLRRPGRRGGREGRHLPIASPSARARTRSAMAGISRRSPPSPSGCSAASCRASPSPGSKCRPSW